LKKNILLLMILFLTSCISDETIQSDKNLLVYNITGYLSSRKDQISLDITIYVDENKNIMEIKGFDTLLNKERFFLIFENNQWFLKENETIYIVDENDNLADILPPIAVFDYAALLRGHLPVLKDAYEEKKDGKMIYKKGNFSEEIIFDEKGLVEKILLYKNDQKIFTFEYKNYLFVQNKIFPKILNIIEHTNYRKIVWWFSNIEIKE